MLGGGTWTSQNKILPGAYINFVSVANADVSLSDRGIATVPINLNWGPSGEPFRVTIDDFHRHCFDIFGYDAEDDALVNVREIFQNAQVVYFYRLNGSGAKASNTYGTAKYPGTRGNDIKVTIAANVDDSSKFDVTAYLGTRTIDKQTVTKADELVDNDYIDWKKDATLAAATSVPMTGGTNTDPTVETWNDYFAAMETYSYNTMGIPTADDQVKKMAVSYVKRLRDAVGKKFQIVLYQYPADYEGVISVENKSNTGNEYDTVYWVTGAEAGCPVNASVMNQTYDGELDIDAKKTQTELEDGILAGKFLFHQVADEVRVLMDLNTLTTFTDEKGQIFQENQTIRVCDQIANDIATLFDNKYLGMIANDEDGRSALWVDICKHHNELQQIQAIEGFTESDVTVTRGDDKRSVVVQDAVTPVNAMAKLYMNVLVS